jgi:hypothetical protein
VPDHDVRHHLSRLPCQKSASCRDLRRRPPQRRPRQSTRRGHREPAKRRHRQLFLGLFKIVGVNLGEAAALQRLKIHRK